MAKIKNSLGIISGTLGELVFVQSKGKNYVRSKPSCYKRNDTQASKDNRIKFGLIIKSLKPFKELLALGFQKEAKGNTGFNAAVSYNIKNAIVGTSPDFKIDFSKLLLCTGSLPVPQNPFIATTVSGNIIFNWTHNPKTFVGNSSDLAVLVVYFESSEKLMYQVTSIGRYAQKATINIPQDISPQKVHCWMAFKAYAHPVFSNSVYLGCFQQE